MTAELLERLRAAEIVRDAAREGSARDLEARRAMAEEAERLRELVAEDGRQIVEWKRSHAELCTEVLRLTNTWAATADRERDAKEFAEGCVQRAQNDRDALASKVDRQQVEIAELRLALLATDAERCEELSAEVARLRAILVETNEGEDNANAENDALRAEVERLRGGAEFVLLLDHYERDNLLWLLNQARSLGCDTGDWCGQIRFKLKPETGIGRPNQDTPNPTKVDADNDRLRAALIDVMPREDEIDSIMSLLNYVRKTHDSDSATRVWLERVVLRAIAEGKP